MQKMKPGLEVSVSRTATPLGRKRLALLTRPRQRPLSPRIPKSSAGGVKSKKQRLNLLRVEGKRSVGMCERVTDAPNRIEVVKRPIIQKAESVCSMNLGPKG